MKGEELLEHCKRLSDEQLVFELKALTANERVGLIKVLGRLAELNYRELEKKTAYPTLFLYCVKVLRYSEHAAFYRSKAAIACRRFPVLLELLESGELHVKAVAMLGEHLTFENHKSLIAQARGASHRQLEALIAGLKPVEKPPERTRVIAIAPAPEPLTAVPRPSDGPKPSRSQPVGDLEGLFPEAAPTAPLVTPPIPVEYRIEHRFTVSEPTEKKIEQARRLLRHKFPHGELESILEEALEALLDRIDPDRRAERARPDRPPREEETRKIPEWVKRRVRERDGEGCAFVSEKGVRCGELDFLQFDHIRPWSEGGRSDDPENIRQLCAAHNQWRERDRRRQALEAGGG